MITYPLGVALGASEQDVAEGLLYRGAVLGDSAEKGKAVIHVLIWEVH